ncbi:MAG TPA: hypothetical protein VKA97_00010 [Pyrinomonadaceae bacterium]|nr:hypothetical protein [Pyrinomonadaceae bacterium]
MKRLYGILAVATLSSLASVAFAQQAPPPDGTLVIKQRVFQGPEGGPPLPPGADFVFVASESFSGKTVKGAPYSAEAVTESIQTLSDGNRIVNRMTSSVYRDSEGRTRREQTLKALGGVGTGDEPLQTIFINDPVAGVTYSLDSRSHIAHKSAPFKFEFLSKPGTPGPEGRRFEFKVEPGSAPGGAVTIAPGGAPPQAGIRVPGPEVEQFTFRTENAGVGGGAFIFRTRGNNANEVKEQLGKQTIEGIEAEGTRTTITIPAGEIGNERAIEIVSERWYSPELQLVVMTRHIDPRSGETTYKLTNINRGEPAKSLFEVPAGYTVKEGPHFGPAVAPLPRIRKQTSPE